MNQISAIGSTPSGGTTEAKNPAGVLGQNGFLKLMIAQLQDQNPMQPSNNNEYINELATFTQMEQMTNLANAGELSGAIGLIGHQVSYKGATETQTGTVESVQTTTSGTTLTISGTKGIAESAVTEIN